MCMYALLTLMVSHDNLPVCHCKVFFYFLFLIANVRLGFYQHRPFADLKEIT